MRDQLAQVLCERVVLVAFGRLAGLAEYPAPADAVAEPNPDCFWRVFVNQSQGMAGTTGLEPAASAVTGQRSNQLNYVPTRQINQMRNRQCLCGFARIA